MKSILKRYDIFLTILLFALMIPAEYMELFSTFENETLSIRHILRTTYGEEEKTRFMSENIAIVDLNEDFFQEYGGFPFKRTDIGKIIDNISLLEPKVVIVDMLFDFKSSYGEDPVLAESLKAKDNIIIVSLLEVDRHTKTVEKIRYPIENLKTSAITAYSNHTPQGNMRNRLTIYPELGKTEQEWPISVKAVSLFLGINPEVKNGQLVIGDKKVTLDQFNEFIIDYPKLKSDTHFLSQDPFVGIAAMDILDMDTEDEDEVDEFKEIIQGKVVLLGDTSLLSHDIFETLVGEVYGIEMMASEVSTLLKNNNLRSASTTLEVIMILFMLIALISIHFISVLIIRLLASVGLMIGYTLLCIYLYVYQDIAFSMGYVYLAGAIGFLFINVFLFIAERKEKGFITNAFGQYLSPDVIDIIVKDPTQLSLGGSRKEMTAFFSDVQGFSTISEGLTPDELVMLLNQYLTEMCAIISGYNGTVDKFEGDAIIAFWGAPLDQPDHARLSCYASIDMQQRMIEQRAEFIAAGKPELYVRMGLNSGPMVVGNMGSQNRMDYTIMGDAVNLAARLEGANKFYKNYSMISENTYKLCSDDIDVRELDRILVVGRNEPVVVYDLMDKKNKVSGKTADMVVEYEKGLGLYKGRNYQDAIKAFNSALKIVPGDGPSISYIDRCQQFIKAPPAADWNGVFKHTEKG